MSINAIMELQDARPFHPFELTLADGSRVVVGHPKWMLVTPDGRTLHCVFSDGPSRRVAVEHITQAVVLENATAAAIPGER